MRAKFSVAMCTYNGARFVREQLTSIAAQTRLPDELIVCDDRSTDDTIQCIRKFAVTTAFPVRIVESEKNLGSTKNFERAMALCEGDYIALADQDDVWLPEKLERLEIALAHKNTGLAFHDGDVVDEHLRSLGRRVWETIRFGPEEQRLFREGRGFALVLDHNVVTGAALAFRSDLRELILPIPNELVHDGVPVLHDWWAALVVAAVANISFVPEPLFKYRQHAAQQMGVTGEVDEHRDALTTRLRNSAQRPNTLGVEIAYIGAILERLLSIKTLPVRANVLSDLEARLKHLKTRAAMPASRLHRVGPVLRDLVAGRYHLYSNGLASVAKDLLFR